MKEPHAAQSCVKNHLAMPVYRRAHCACSPALAISVRDCAPILPGGCKCCSGLRGLSRAHLSFFHQAAR